MKINNGNRVVLHVKDEYVIIMAEDKHPTSWDPMEVYWGVAQGYRVVTDVPSNTLVLVPIGEPSRVKYSDFKPEDLVA